MTIDAHFIMDGKIQVDSVPVSQARHAKDNISEFSPEFIRGFCAAAFIDCFTDFAGNHSERFEHSLFSPSDTFDPRFLFFSNGIQVHKKKIGSRDIQQKPSESPKAGP